MMNRKKISHFIKAKSLSRVLVISLIIASNFCFAQSVGINSTGTIPNPSALLDVDAAPGNNKGLLIPRIGLQSTTDVVTIPTPATSLLVYNSNAAMVGGGLGFWYWDGAKWVAILNNSSLNNQGAWLLTGNAGTNTGINFVGTTDNVSLRFRTNNTAKMIIDSTGNIGIKTTTPVISVQINATDAIGIPSGTTLQQPAGAPVGSTRYNTTTGVMEVFNGTCWQNVNTPPIGSTFIQWFGAADPNTIYPCTVWIGTDISNGEFLRATGGLSNVASLGGLTGVVQNFATQDHTHFSTGTIANSPILTTSTDGLHNHTGNTTGVSTFNAAMWIPYDDNLTSDEGNAGDFGGSNPSTCGLGWDGKPTAGNFMGQLNQNCLDHTHGINFDGLHFHTIPPHTHTLTLSVGNMSSGNVSTETRPTNVAVTFWRRTQ